MVIVEEDDRAVVISFDRPAKRNALTIAMSRELEQTLRGHADTPKPLIFRSSTPGMFVGGTDAAEVVARTVDDSLARTNARLFQSVWEHPWPTIAAVDGPALGGGCELALACDFRLCSSRAVWGLPEVTLGIIPGAGGLTRLPGLVGWGLAVDMILTGRRLSAAEATAAGLVSTLTADGELHAAVDDLVERLSRTSPRAVRIAKEAMRVEHDPRRLVDAVAQALCLSDDETQRRLGALAGTVGTS